jgi:2-succinyl-5-enolpyruvyl-6-hydroxy-3-cyclohexene-1-carboxylate synthase
MTIYKENLNILWGSLLVEELIRNGINYFCLSPGSRSTPLTVAVARNPKAEPAVIYDERAAAFHALGYSRATGKPAVLICTSGTAAANYFPAIVEASLDLIPMIVLSADRPPEKIDTGANQTIRQSKMYGDYVRWFFDLPCPTAEIPPQMVLTTINHCIYKSLTQPPGPVHLNCQFREQLVPVRRKIPPDYLRDLDLWNRHSHPYTSYSLSAMLPEEQIRKDLLKIIRKTSKGLLVVGRLHSDEEKLAVRSFSRKLDWPVFTDILSGQRLGNGSENLLPYFDLMLLAEHLHQKYQPDTIIHMGDQPASKRYLQFVDKNPPRNYISLLPHSFRSDPTHRVTWRMETGLREFCEQFSHSNSVQIDRKWLGFLKKCSHSVGRFLDSQLKKNGNLSEPAIARLISQLIPKEHSLFLASSLPIREVDMFADPGGNPIPISANRGVSGIDGTIASALGYARGRNKPLTLLIGDLAFLHDLNSLSLISAQKIPITIVLINNRGGGIFSFLPIADFKEVFEPFFGTPHHYSFAETARQFELTYSLPGNTGEFETAYQKAVKSRKSTLIEVQTNRQDNVEFHSRLYDQIRSILNK